MRMIRRGQPLHTRRCSSHHLCGNQIVAGLSISIPNDENKQRNNSHNLSITSSHHLNKTRFPPPPPNTRERKRNKAIMRLNNKRKADDESEAQPSRATKRQAVIPTTRVTRSTRKLNEDNGISVQLDPGLSMAPRRRKKQAWSTATTTTTPWATLQKCTPPSAVEAVPSRAANHVELVILPASAYVPAPRVQPVRQAPTKPPSVIYATGITPDGQHICAPIRIGSDRPARSQPEVMAVAVTTDQEMTEAAPWLESANAGGPAPVAYMGDDFPMGITCITDLPPHQNPQRKNSQQWRREPSHSSLISPRSGPVQLCMIPTPSRPNAPRLPLAQDSRTDADIPITATKKIKQDWTNLNPDWLSKGDEMWKLPKFAPKPAVVDATYSVNSLEEAAELLANEMCAHDFEQYIESPVVDIFAADSLQGVVDEDLHVSQMSDDCDPVIVECGARVPSLDSMEWTMGDATTEVPDVRSDDSISDLTSCTEYTRTSCSLNAANPFPSPSNSSTKGSVSGCIIERDHRHPTTIMEPFKSTLTSPVADVPTLPDLHQKTAQQIANLKREKELRKKIIEMRRARMAAPRTCVQNVLVRAPDGSLSIVTTQDTAVTNWGVEEDQYSVEEYEEDSVSY